MTFRIYLRDQYQQVTDKTVTGDPDAARSAFASLVNRTDLDGTTMLAVLNRDGKPVAHHWFGTPSDPAKWWRGRTDQIDFSKAA